MCECVCVCEIWKYLVREILQGFISWGSGESNQIYEVKVNNLLSLSPTISSIFTQQSWMETEEPQESDKENNSELAVLEQLIQRNRTMN